MTYSADMGFAVERLDYALPADLIAQVPSPARGSARMLVVHRAGGRLEDDTVGWIGRYLRAGDVLVLNDTRVIAARFMLERVSGGRIEGLFLRQASPTDWVVMLKGARRIRAGERLRMFARPDFGPVEVVRCTGRGVWILRWPEAVDAVLTLRDTGRMPLPPYIRRGKQADARDAMDRARYQTVYAARDGAVAAPTAGLHFDEPLLERLAAGGVAIETVTLHVGYGTFAPIEVEDLAEHAMHAEYFEISDAVCRKLTSCRAAGGRVVAVGTTSARVLETAFVRNAWRGGQRGWTDLFCYPPYAFGGVDALVTNFHLPRSTLLALVMAFAGTELTGRAYAHAVGNRYRFYSYGDAMLIL